MNNNRRGKNQYNKKQLEAEDNGERKYIPPDWAYRYLSACLDWEIKATISARCAAAKMSRTTLYEALNDNRFVQWLDDRLSQIVKSEHREVKTSLLKLCMKGDLEAIRLWHQLYGDFIPTERKIVDGDVSRLSDQKLLELARGLAESSTPGTGQKVH